MSAPAQKTLPGTRDHGHAHDRRRALIAAAHAVSSAIIVLVERVADVGTIERQVLDDAVAAGQMSYAWRNHDHDEVTKKFVILRDFVASDSTSGRRRISAAGSAR